MGALRQPVILPYGDSAMLIDWGGTIDAATNARVLGLAHAVMEAALSGVEECVPGYTSLLIVYDPFHLEYQELEARITQMLSTLSGESPRLGRVVEIPVRYGGEDGPDLRFVAEHCGITEDEVIHLHSADEYQVYFIGFLPGFPYLGGMDARLTTPRLEKPRQRVPACSVGIAGRQTGIYPLDSPGGWRIIGRTDEILFDAHRAVPALLSPGDRVRFKPVEGRE